MNIADFPGLQPEFILDQLPVGLLITDANDAIIWANAEAAHLSGWPAAELRGMPLDRVIAKPELAAIARARDVGDIRALGRCHCRLLSKSAEEREVSVALVPLAAAGGPAMVVLVREIQRQREFERRMLRQLAEKQRVFFNLLLNAYEAVEKGGRVTVACQSLLERKQVCLSIEDTGPGIAPSYLETSLFRPFRSTKPGGMGLGLFHAKTIIEEHGGSLDVANRTGGRGAVVTVVLPAGTAVPKMFVKEEERSCFDPRF